MKKFISAVISAAIALSCVSVSVHAEATSTVYEIDTATKTIKNVAPLTKVSAFESNITDAEVDVVNVDGTSMADTAYATDNVFAKIDNVIYKIETKALYQPIKDKAASLEDGKLYYDIAGTSVTETINTTFGFNRYGSFSKFGYGKDTTGNPANTDDQKFKVSKITYAGEAAYKIESDTATYAYLRSHAGYKATTDTTLREETAKYDYAVTNYKFTADKLGNISLFHNMAARDDKAASDYDSAPVNNLKSDYAKYAGNAVHFLEDGKIMVGGTYEFDKAANRKPFFTVGEWTPNIEYNVSIVQKGNSEGRDHYVYGIYINGVKVFPSTDINVSTAFCYKSDKDAYYMYAGGSRWYPGIGSIRFATAPKTAGDNLTVNLSDFQVYGLNTKEEFDVASTKQSITLGNAADVTVSETDAKITDAVAETVASFKAKYPNVVMGIYNADGTMAANDAYLTSEMKVMVASADGLQGKTYALTATEPLNENAPEAMTGTYTVNADTKTISGVAANTTVADFLAKFKNAVLMEVINIDGSKMADTAYATENVSVKFANGDIYTIEVSDFTPLKTYASALEDGTSVYNKIASEVTTNVTVDAVDPGKHGTTYGFTKLQKYGKIGFGNDNLPPENTAEQTVKGTKKTINGETVYVMENDSNNYAYLRTHQTSSLNYSTDLATLTSTYDGVPVVTTVEFEADELGNISVFNNIPKRNTDGSMAAGDCGIDALHYSTDLPYIPTSVHFLEDGSVKLGGMYAGDIITDTSDGYSTEIRSPKQLTNFTWEPGVKYTVSVVQRYKRGTREGWVDGVYVNGEKIFPNELTVNATGSPTRVCLDGDSYKITTREDSYRYGGGVSSVMIGTAPKDANDNLTVYLSDVKVYKTAAYNPAADMDIALASSNPLVKVDNENATITCMEALSLSDITTTAKLKLEGNLLKAVSADGLVSKTYKVEVEGIVKGFYNGENGPEITALADAVNNVCFVAGVEKDSIAVGTSPLVMLAVYSKTTKKMLGSIEATGVAYTDEITKYVASIDISQQYDKNDIEFRGFIWNGLQGIAPISVVSELK